MTSRLVPALALVTLGACAASGPSHQTGSMSAIEHHVDRLGYDYRTLHFDPSGSPETCRDACMVEVRCMAWAFVYPRNGRAAQCWLKSVIPPSTFNEDVASGFKDPTATGAAAGAPVTPPQATPPGPATPPPSPAPQPQPTPSPAPTPAPMPLAPTI
jgi:hypothetical protein